MNSDSLRVLKYLNLNAQETNTHLSNVVTLTTELLSYVEKKANYGIDYKYKASIINASLLHDIGKAAIPEKILYKRGALNENERMIIETHPLTGVYLLKKIVANGRLMKEKSFEENNILANVIMYHHERWDGKGYPNGIKGEEIPIESRVITIVDIYDALTSERCYKKAWTKEQALVYLKEEKGKIFDPELVSNFIEMMQKKEAGVLN